MADVEHKLTVQVQDDDIIFKMYSGSTVIYQWTAPVGSTVEDVADIYPHFLIDNENGVGKPSFVYYNGDSTYQYNQESPTVSEMEDIYKWLVWSGVETTILWSGNSNTMTAQVSNGHIVFNLYTGITNIYSFNAYVGTAVNDIRNINIGFLVDTTNEVAKPSIIYDNGDNTYTYNAEEPTDAEMALIYTWLSAGLPSA